MSQVVEEPVVEEPLEEDDDLLQFDDTAEMLQEMVDDAVMEEGVVEDETCDDELLIMDQATNIVAEYQHAHPAPHRPEEEETENYNESTEYNDTAEYNEENTEPVYDAKLLYQNKLAKPIFSVGKTSLSYADAKMYGLLDANGEIASSKIKASSVAPTKLTSRVMNISKPREKPKPIADPEATFSFTRKGAKGDDKKDDKNAFLNRVEAARGKGGGSVSGASKDKMKEDYEARLDKLQCPTCKKLQSFDEFIEKRRFCGLCKQRFVQLHVCNAGGFEKRMAAAQQKKQAAIDALEHKVYGNDGKNAVTHPAGGRRPHRPTSGTTTSEQVMINLKGANEAREKEMKATVRDFQKQQQQRSSTTAPAKSQLVNPAKNSNGGVKTSHQRPPLPTSRPSSSSASRPGSAGSGGGSTLSSQKSSKKDHFQELLQHSDED